MKEPRGPKDGLGIERRDLSDATTLSRWHQRQGRAVLKELLNSWHPCLVFSEGEPCGRLSKRKSGTVEARSSNRRLLLRFDENKLRQELSPNNFAIVQLLLDQLIQQSNVARVAVPLAKAEMATQLKRLAGARKGGDKSKKDSRATVEGLIRAALRRKSDPRQLFPRLEEEFDYSRPQLLNILKSVKAETP